MDIASSPVADRRGGGRQLVARLAATLALGAGNIALGTWWAALLVARAAGTSARSAASTVLSGLGAAGGSGGSGVDRALQRASATLGSAASSLGVTAGAGSTGRPGALSLGGLLGPSSTPDHDLAGWAHRLHGDATLALGVALALAATAVVLARHRRPVLRRLAWGGLTVAGLALVVTWAVPAVAADVAHGAVRHLARDLLQAGAPVRPVLWGVEAAAVVVALAVALVRPASGRPLTGRRAREAALLTAVGADQRSSTWSRYSSRQ